MKLMLLIFTIIGIIAAGVYLYPVQSVLLFAWFGILCFIQLKHLDKKLSIQNRRLYYSVALIYPILETIIKIFLMYEVVPGSWAILNRFEHFLFSASILILIYPLIRNWVVKQRLFETFLFQVGIINLIGIANEIFEYYLRIALDLTRFELYYQDTIKDLILNFLGAILGFIIINRTQLFRHQKPKE